MVAWTCSSSWWSTDEDETIKTNAAARVREKSFMMMGMMVVVMTRDKDSLFFLLVGAVVLPFGVRCRKAIARYYESSKSPGEEEILFGNGRTFFSGTSTIGHSLLVGHLASHTTKTYGDVVLRRSCYHNFICSHHHDRSLWILFLCNYRRRPNTDLRRSGCVRVFIIFVWTGRERRP